MSKKRVTMRITFLVDSTQFEDHEEYVFWATYVMIPENITIHSNEIGDSVTEEVEEIKILSVEDVKEKVGP